MLPGTCPVSLPTLQGSGAIFAAIVSPQGRHSAAKTRSPVYPTDTVADLELLKCLQKGLMAASTGCSLLTFLFSLSRIYVLSL